MGSRRSRYGRKQLIKVHVSDYHMERAAAHCREAVQSAADGRDDEAECWNQATEHSMYSRVEMAKIWATTARFTREGDEVAIAVWREAAIAHTGASEINISSYTYEPFIAEAIIRRREAAEATAAGRHDEAECLSEASQVKKYFEVGDCGRFRGCWTAAANAAREEDAIALVTWKEVATALDHEGPKHWRSLYDHDDFFAKFCRFWREFGEIAVTHRKLAVEAIAAGRVDEAECWTKASDVGCRNRFVDPCRIFVVG